MSGGLTEFERNQVERMAAADAARAPEVMVDVIVAALNGAAKAGVTSATMILVLDKVSQKILDRSIERGGSSLARITAPRKGV